MNSRWLQPTDGYRHTGEACKNKPTEAKPPPNAGLRPVCSFRPLKQTAIHTELRRASQTMLFAVPACAGRLPTDGNLYLGFDGQG